MAAFSTTNKITINSVSGNTFGEDWKLLSVKEWRRLKAGHEKRIDQLLGDYLAQRSRHAKNPVLDFLFEYYSFRPSLLRRWSPGIGLLLEGKEAERFLDHEVFIRLNDAVAVDPSAFPTHRIESTRWILRLLQAVQSRSPRLGCFGLHEWAMVYRTEQVRHPYYPLRLSPDEIAAFVDTRQIACSHFDAFRFFTRPARPLNHLQPGHNDRLAYEQPGCVHVTMDLYKWSYKIYPWIPGDLLADSFELAVQARTIDMQASPYDLREYHLEPIEIETPEGRTEYSEKQKMLAEKAGPIRQRLIKVYEQLLQHLNVQDFHPSRD